EVVEADRDRRRLLRTDGHEADGREVTGVRDRCAERRPVLAVLAHPAAVAVTGAVEPQVPVAALGRAGQVDGPVATGPEGTVDLRDELGTQVERRTRCVARDDVEL